MEWPKLFPWETVDKGDCCTQMPPPQVPRMLPQRWLRSTESYRLSGRTLGVPLPFLGEAQAGRGVPSSSTAFYRVLLMLFK